MTDAVRYGVQIGAIDHSGVKDADLYNEAIAYSSRISQLPVLASD